MKTCIWCLNPCEKYIKEIAVYSRTLSDQEATEYRKAVAYSCPDYVTSDDDNLQDTYHKNEPKINIPIETCKIGLEAMSNPPCKRAVPGIATCPECGHAMCPICNRHNVTQLSRVTGYIGDVGGWNEAKKQELKDRKRYNLR